MKRKKVNKEARLRALDFVRSFAVEGSNIDSDFIQDREDFNQIPDFDLAKEMEFVVKVIDREKRKISTYL